MKVAIIGAGTMGSGITQIFAQSELVECVYLTDISRELAENGKKKIQKALSRLIMKGKIGQLNMDIILSKIIAGEKGITVDADLVLEAASENINIKKKILSEYDTIVKPNAIFATNTSSLSITEIGQGLNHDFIGMHFFNPAPVMKLVEVIAGFNTLDVTVKKIMEISEALGKTPIKVSEAPGFVVNRLLIPMINESVGIFADGIASAEDIDTAMKLGANHPMGPLALGDLIGLDVVLSIMEVLQRETGDDKYRPHPLLRKMVRANKLGRKTGVGFYEY